MMSYLDLARLAFPELIVVFTAFVVLAVDLFALRDSALALRFRLLSIVSVAGAGLAGAALLALGSDGEFMRGMLLVDPLSRLVKAAVLFLFIGTALISAGTPFTQDPGEYFSVLLFGTVGMMFLVSSEDLLMIFLSLELTSLCLYILVGFNKADIRSAEAALKYFLFGGSAAAFTLFGISLLYGVSGTLYLPEVAAGLCRAWTTAGAATLDPIIVLGIVMTLVGFAFKVAAAPFHLWAPDVYQGAPLPAAAFIASGSKVASFFVLGRVLLTGLQGTEGGLTPWWSAPGWMQVLAVLITSSLLLGNLAAMAQTSFRRLLAYSAIAHAGYLLLAFAASGHDSLSALLYYSITYSISTLGAFGIAALLESKGTGGNLEHLTGLGRRSPSLAFCLVIFILSLAGIPPLAGFFAKFYVFAAALETRTSDFEAGWLVALAIAMSAVSLYYYLRVLKYVYVAPEDARYATMPPQDYATRATVIACAVLTLLLGCFPNLLLAPLDRAVQAAGF